MFPFSPVPLLVIGCFQQIHAIQPISIILNLKMRFVSIHESFQHKSSQNENENRSSSTERQTKQKQAFIYLLSINSKSIVEGSQHQHQNYILLFRNIIMCYENSATFLSVGYPFTGFLHRMRSVKENRKKRRRK